MSCKGLVELIVLNIGLQAKILGTRVFTIFVVMALITTFATTPLTSALYPPWYQRKLQAWKRGEIDWESGAPLRNGDSSFEEDRHQQKRGPSEIRSLLIYLRLDNIFDAETNNILYRIQVHGVRIVQLTARTTSVMTVSEVGELSAFDPVLNAFRVLGQLYNLAVSGEVAVVPEDSYAETLTTRASEEFSDLLLLPWTETGSLSESPMVSKNTIEQKLRSDAYSRFIAEALETSNCTTAVFINKAFSGSLEQSPLALTRRILAKSGRGARRDPITELPTLDRSHHIFMPFFGGADAQAAVHLALQLAENPEITVTIVHYQIRVEISSSDDAITTRRIPEGKIRVRSSCDKTVTGDDDDFFVATQHALPDALRPRVTFRTIISYDPVQDAVADAQTEVGQNLGNGGDIIMLGRNVELVETQISSCLGLVADVMLEKDVKASIVVVQARKE
ncbi:hypothetical protein K458DRAFT_487957 [Lentithecium fluviatile CBS 122367]|uniref:Uncharacterized protein n=1 Tax=Lentithecium fluviatile CBS 122367 TaxID=1168545 RepID=A0A6G1IZC4_9PLEO|nr:hypothetical protein K458DRAFT_487957 [Lentithecium fluviatile CBS 122367]